VRFQSPSGLPYPDEQKKYELEQSLIGIAARGCWKIRSASFECKQSMNLFWADVRNVTALLHFEFLRRINPLRLLAKFVA
jgi:hypothetical protein